jgi:hypothetical protein
MVVGLCFTSLLVSTYSLPTLTGWFNDLPYFQAALLMIALALPMYVCSLPGILMGATFILSGLRPELLWVFLMSGPVTNLGDLNVLRRQVGGAKRTMIYIATVIALTLLWGWVMKAILDPVKMWMYVQQYFREYPSIIAGTLRVIESPPPQKEMAVSDIIHYLSAFIYIGLIVFGIYSEVKRVWKNPCSHCTHYQQNLNLTITSCRVPCWKRRFITLLRKRKYNPL